MNTTVEKTMAAPNVSQLREALLSFYTVSAGVAHARAREYGPERFSLISRNLSQSFADNLTIQEVEKAIEDFDEKSNMALATIYEELAYITKRYESYGRSLNEEMIMPELAAEYDVEQGSAFDDDTVKEIDVVKGSLNFVLKKLPKSAQRMLDVLMEILKIARGGI